MSRRGIAPAIAALLCLGATYHAPDLKDDLFGGTLTLDDAHRRDAATALAMLVCNHWLPNHPDDLKVAARVTGLALRLDPKNTTALDVENQLENGKTPPADTQRGPGGEYPIVSLARLAKSQSASSSKPDQLLGSYLYSILSQLFPKRGDFAREASTLSDAVFATRWDWADGAPTPATPSRNTKVQPVTTVRGLVVTVAADGMYHGKAVDLIATRVPSKQAASDFKLIGQVGREMKISFQEATRLVKLRHPSLAGANVEVSFGDKYSGKDGGSAGCAFTVLLLAAIGDFKINPDAAMTGDITVDSKVREVGEVPAKVHGAALDKCKVISVPAENAHDMEDAVLLAGPGVLWETQIFSSATLDDAIAVVRLDPAPKMAQARTAFDELRTKFSDKPLAAWSTPEGRAALQHVIDLAPNHVSAGGLLRLAEGKGSTRLSVQTSVEQLFGAIGLMRTGLVGEGFAKELGSLEATTAAHQSLGKLRKIVDPSSVNVLTAMDSYCTAYGKWAYSVGVAGPRGNATLRDDLVAKATSVRAALAKVISDPAVIDKMMH